MGQAGAAAHGLLHLLLLVGHLLGCHVTHLANQEGVFSNTGQSRGGIFKLRNKTKTILFENNFALNSKPFYKHVNRQLMLENIQKQNFRTQQTTAQ